jgi:hypothetical protein
MTPRHHETFEPVTLGHIRGHGCRDLLVYCESVGCNHSAVMNADWLPDETPVRSLSSRDGLHGVWSSRSGRGARLVTTHEQALLTPSCLRSRLRLTETAPIIAQRR